jgi:hypothetical protein
MFYRRKLLFFGPVSFLSIKFFLAGIGISFIGTGSRDEHFLRSL